MPKKYYCYFDFENNFIITDMRLHRYLINILIPHNKDAIIHQYHYHHREACYKVLVMQYLPVEITKYIHHYRNIIYYGMYQTNLRLVSLDCVSLTAILVD